MNFPHPNKAAMATLETNKCNLWAEPLSGVQRIPGASVQNNATAYTVLGNGASLGVGSFNFSPARNKTRLIPWLREKQYPLAGCLSMVNSILPPTMHAHASDGMAPSWLMCSQGLMLCSGFGGGFDFGGSKQSNQERK